MVLSPFLSHPNTLVRFLLSLPLFFSSAQSALDISTGSDSDLTRFVTRPELRAPILRITHHSLDPDSESSSSHPVSPGYWFLGPYAKVSQERFATYYYQACSTGPHIYDADGELIWSGACAARNANACDFRAFDDPVTGETFASTIFYGLEENFADRGVIFGADYQIEGEGVRTVHKQPLDTEFNMHEFNVIEGGKKALYITYRSDRREIPELGIAHMPVGWVSNVGFREVDVATGEVDFEWWSGEAGRVSPAESSYPINEKTLAGPFPTSWNWFHPNSIDKSPSGDYLMSGRFVDTIYKISGKDGSILWRLGGRNSSFHMDGFNFSKQHDARFLTEYDPVTGTEIISLFDNAVAHQAGWISEATSNTSSCMVVALDHSTMTAKLTHQIYRPDGGLTALRGNFQLLPNGNAVAGWSENGYVSEHAPDGRLLLEGEFASKRFATYRAYKYNFTGIPVEPPTLKAFVVGVRPSTSTTAWYVSWNGATEVVQWRFCRVGKGSLPSTVGLTPKKGFETAFVSDGFERLVYVEAVAANGSVIGHSQPQLAELPREWGIGDGLSKFELPSPGQQIIIE